jgi:hypothetical protein
MEPVSGMIGRRWKKEPGSKENRIKKKDKQ